MRIPNFKQRELIKFIHQRPKLFAKSFVDRPENVVGFEMLAIDAAAGADVVAHLFEPGELVGSESDSGGAFFFEPSGEALADVFFEWFERSCRFDGSADKRTRSVKRRVCESR